MYCEVQSGVQGEMVSIFALWKLDLLNFSASVRYQHRRLWKFPRLHLRSSSFCWSSDV